MTDENIKIWLQELYDFDPSLREHESALYQIIPQMIKARPESPFTPTLAQQIKSRLNQELEKTKHKNMTKQEPKFWRPALLWSFGVVAVLFIVVSVYQTTPGDLKTPINSLIKPNESVIKKVAAGAYGPLNTKGVNNNTKGNALGIGAGGASESVKTLSATTAVTGMATEAAVSSDTAIAEPRMIMPIFNYRYVYQGEPLNLSELKNTVYRRIKSASDQGIANSLGGLSIGDLKLSSLSNLKTTYLSISEDKPFGLTAYLDFNEDSASLYQNWEKWQNPALQACRDDACWQSFRVKIEDIPADEVAINETNQFLNNIGVNLEHYGEAQVNNYWRKWYDQAENKNDFYLPESVSVIYPLMIDGQMVNNQSGEPEGIFVGYQILEKRVSSAGPFTPYRYEASEYAIETNSDRLIKLAEAGGWNNYGGLTSTEGESFLITLGTPRAGLVHFFSYVNNESQELYAPALIFPVTNAPENYYGSQSIIVPLTLDLINELDQRNVNTDGSGGVIMPLFDAPMVK